MHVNNYGRHLFNTVSHGNVFKMTFSMDVRKLNIAKTVCFRLYLKKLQHNYHFYSAIVVYSSVFKCHGNHNRKIYE